MTGQRDIDRTLDAWFVDGPTMMPDRLFDAVLDQVGRTRQRPLALLNLRLREMNPKIRLYTVLAAALLVVVAAIAVIGGGTQRAVSSTDAPTTVPTTAASAVPSSVTVDVPAALAATWMGGHRPAVTDDADGGTTLVFDSGQLWMTPSNQSTEHALVSNVGAADAESLQLVTAAAFDGCAVGDAGFYSWTVSTTGRTLELTLVSDVCVNRAQSVPGTYWLMDCPTFEDNCLGPLDPGTYSSQFIDPFIGPSETWSPRFGALTYTVPDGWVNVDDWPTTFSLAPEEPPGTTGLYVMSDVVAASDACAQQQAAGVGETAEELATWVAALPGVDATAPEHRTVGGLDGWLVDVSLKPSYAKTCNQDGGFVSRGLFTDRPSEEGFGWTLNPGTPMRLFFASLDDGRALVAIIKSDHVGVDEGPFLAEATAIVESFSIQPG